MMSFVREECECCHKSIYFGQSISECSLCNAVIHTNCFKKSSFNFNNGNCYCANCYSCKYIPRYNPYKKFISEASQPGIEDRAYNEDPIDIIDTIQTLSNILENCTSYENMEDINKSNIFAQQGKLSTMFLNTHWLRYRIM